VFIAKYSVWHHGAWVVGDYVDDSAGAITALDHLRDALHLHQRGEPPEPSPQGETMSYQMLVQPDGRSRMPFASDAIRTLFRLTPDEVRADCHRMAGLIHPADLKGLLDKVIAVNHTGGEFRHTYRTRFPDGEVVHLHSEARVTIKSNGVAKWEGIITRIPPAVLG